MGKTDEAGTSGKGSGRGSGGGRKGRFTPTVTNARRKKEDGNQAPGSVSQAGPSDGAFKDLVTAAKTEAHWERGARGRGRGQAQQRYQVTFGGGADAQMALPDVKYKPGRAAGGGGGGGGAGGSKGGPGKGGGAKAGAKGPATKTEDGALLPYGEAGDDDLPYNRDWDVLDYEQYYPTTLPLAPPPGLQDVYPRYDDTAGEGPPGQGDMKYSDLALAEEVPDCPAVELRLLERVDPDHLFLVQLPNLMPLAATNAPQQASGSKDKGAAKEPGVQAAQSLKDLGSGMVGKLLVFKSGKVVLQCGDVLLDVSAGTHCMHRQDVVALNHTTGDAVFLGEVAQRVVVSPDIWQLMADAPVPDWPRDKFEPGVTTVTAPAVAAGRGAASASMQVDEKEEEEEGEEGQRGEEEQVDSGMQPSPVKQEAPGVVGDSVPEGGSAVGTAAASTEHKPVVHVQHKAGPASDGAAAAGGAKAMEVDPLVVEEDEEMHDEEAGQEQYVAEHLGAGRGGDDEGGDEEY